MDFWKILREAAISLCEPTNRRVEAWQIRQGFILCGGKGDAPDPPDYRGAAREEAQGSVQAAIANAYLNRPTQSTPYGTQSWTQNGSINVPGIGGNPGFVLPNFQSETNLTPEGKQLFNADTAIKLGLSKAGQTSLGQVQDSLDDPFNLSGLPGDYNQKVADAMYNRSLANLDPQWEQEEERAKTALINSGFSVGNEGYTRAMDNFDRRKSAAYGDARDRSVIAGTEFGQRDRNQGISELLLQRQQPLTELNALRTGASPNMPAFANGNVGANAQGANLLGAAQASGQAQNDIYNADMGSYNATLGAVGTGLGAWAGLAATGAVAFF